MDTALTAGHQAGAAFRLSSTAVGQFAAAGPLTFATATAACEAGLHTLLEGSDGELELDCRGITAADSAGLSVLLEWLSAARHAGRKLRYTHLPEGLLALGRISELEELLERGV